MAGPRASLRALGVWYLAVRPWTLPASLVPVLVGGAAAFLERGRVDPWLLLLTLTGAVLVQMGTNLVDEYADAVRGGGSFKYPAPHKVIARGLLSPRAVRRGAFALFGLATLIGLYLVKVAGWPLLWVCLAGLGAAYFYGAGPLGRLGLGEPLVFLFMGPVMVAGTYYVQARALAWEPLLLSLPVGFLVTAILVANDLRDAEEDRLAGKRTPITAWGLPFGRRLFAGLVTGAAASVAALVLLRPSWWPLLLVTLALPRSAAVVRRVLTARGREDFHRALTETAGLHLRFGLLLTAGTLLSRLTGG